MYKVGLRTFLVVSFLMAAVPVVAQESRDDREQSRSAREGDDTTSMWSFWLRGQGQFHENFFQATEGREEEDVFAALGEVGAGLRFTENSPLQAYGAVNYLHYDFENLDSSTGIRVGLRSNGRPHSFDVYGEQLSDRPTFEVGDEFATADIRTFAGEYAFRFVEQWQISFDGELQEQEIELAPTRDNDFNSLGAAVRWRPSRLFSPEIGYRTGERQVVDERLSYEQDELYLQVRSSLTPAVYLSVRLRDRQREYTTDVVNASNFGREDDRQQISAALDWTLSRAVVLNFYGSQENVDTNREGGDFDTATYVAGVTLRR